MSNDMPMRQRFRQAAASDRVLYLAQRVGSVDISTDVATIARWSGDDDVRSGSWVNFPRQP